MGFLRFFCALCGVAFFICYSYQFFYIPVALLRKKKAPPAEVPLHRFAVLVCARNEETVVGDLVSALARQNYPRELLSVFVLADNCTDRTAEIAREAGARVYERSDAEHVGKGYALQALLAHVHEDHPGVFDGFFVFDADNLPDPDYVRRMNEVFSSGYEIVTGCRNSKNFGDNWVSAGYGLWFLRESQFLNRPRAALGVSCAVGGTGFLFSRAVTEEMHGWPFHTLTEDIEFSAFEIARGRKIGYCEDAVLYDEQPTSFAQSWRQRRRWTKGYLQVLRRYARPLVRGIFRGSFSCFDICMNILPAFVLSGLSLIAGGLLAALTFVQGGTVGEALLGFGQSLGGMLLTLFVLGLITAVAEWRNIHTSAAKKVLYTFTFPLFMCTFLPVAFSALFGKADWKPIRHTVNADALSKRGGDESLPL